MASGPETVISIPPKTLVPIIFIPLGRLKPLGSVAP